MLVEQWSGELGNCLLRLDGCGEFTVSNSCDDDASQWCCHSRHETALRGNEIARSGSVVEQCSKQLPGTVAG